MTDNNYGQLTDEWSLELPQHKKQDEAHQNSTKEGSTLKDSVKIQTELQSYGKIFTSLLSSSIPSIFYLVSMLFIVATTLHFVGKSDDTALYNGTALGNSTLYCLSMYLIISLNMGFTAIASQAYGSGLHKLVGLYLHRNIIINLGLTSLVYILLYFSYNMFISIGIEEDIARVASYYLRYSPFLTFGMILYDNLKCYLYAHDIYTPQFFMQIVLAIIHWFSCDYFINSMQLGIKGVTIVMTLSSCLGNLFMMVYFTVSNPDERSWFCLRKESFQELFALFKRELPIAAMVYFEWIVFHILVFMASYLGKQDMAAFVTLSNAQSLLYVVPLGLSISVTTLVGNAVGEKNHEKTMRMIKASVFTGLIVLSSMTVIFYFYRHLISYFYVHDPQILASLDKLYDVYIFAMPADFLQCILGGVIKGIGMEKAGSASFLIIFYLIGLPCSYLFCFVWGYEAVGLWIGMTIALYILVLVFVIIVYKADLGRQILMVEERLTIDNQKSSAPLQSP